MERVKGIEPSQPAWEAGVLPLNYTRTCCGGCRSENTLLSIAREGAKSKPFIKKHTRLFVILASLAIVATGLLTYKDIFSILPIIGVLLHTGAFWMDDEKKIRIVSFLGSPFWLVYNFVSGAYGSCIGDILSMVSIAIAMVRYDILPAKRK